MSETLAAVLIVPFLVALVIGLEGSRICCQGFTRRRKALRTNVPVLTSVGELSESISTAPGSV